MKTSTMKKPREKPSQFRVVGKNETAEPSATGWKSISRVNLGGIAKTGESNERINDCHPLIIESLIVNCCYASASIRPSKSFLLVIPVT